MKSKKDKEYILLETINKVKHEVKNEQHYIILEKRKKEILEYLNTNKITDESKDLLEEYEKIGKQINDIEMKTAFEISIYEKSKRKGMWKILIKTNWNKRYQDEFNKIWEDNEYKRKIRRHKEIFKILTQKIKNSDEVLYELESIETEIATILTERIREYMHRDF